MEIVRIKYKDNRGEKTGYFIKLNNFNHTIKQYIPITIRSDIIVENIEVINEEGIVFDNNGKMFYNSKL